MESGAEKASPVGEDERTGLVCSRCSAVIAHRSEVLSEKAVIMQEAVFCYELDMCGKEDVWCYSATNPGANRFDVVRVDAQSLSPGGDTCLSGVTLSWKLTTEHSWFPPYGWKMCSCGRPRLPASEGGSEGVFET